MTEPVEVVYALLNNNWSLLNTDRLHITWEKLVRKPNVLNTDYIGLSEISGSETGKTIDSPPQIDTDAVVRCDLKLSNHADLVLHRDEIRTIVLANHDLRQLYPTEWSTIIPIRTIKRNTSKSDSFFWWFYDLRLTAVDKRTT